MNDLKHWIKQRLKFTHIDDKNLIEDIYKECKQSNRQILKDAIKKYKFLRNNKNTHEKLWKKTDTGFELEAAVEDFDWYINAKIKFNKKSNLYIGAYETGPIDMDKDNILNELYLEDMGLKGEDQPIKNADYKVIMREIYYMHQNELDKFISDIS